MAPRPMPNASMTLKMRPISCAWSRACVSARHATRFTLRSPESRLEHCSGGFYRLEGMAFPARVDCVTIPALRGFQEEVVAMLKFLALIGLLAIAVAVAAGVGVFGGFFILAASGSAT